MSDKMKYISVFSGIEAASVAWETLGLEPVAFSEIDPFASSVLGRSLRGAWIEIIRYGM